MFSQAATPPCGSSDRKRSPAARLFWRKPWGKRRMGSLVEQCFPLLPYDTFLLLLPLFQIRCQVPPSARSLHYFDESTHDSVQRLQPLRHVGREEHENDSVLLHQLLELVCFVHRCIVTHLQHTLSGERIRAVHDVCSFSHHGAKTVSMYMANPPVSIHALGWQVITCPSSCCRYHRTCSNSSAGCTGWPFFLRLIVLKTCDGNPLGWRAHGRNARGQADHEELAHMVVD